MSFEPTLEMLILFKENRLEESMRKAVEKHLHDGCAQCDRQMKWVTQILEALHGSPIEVPPEAMAAAGRRIFADHRRRVQESDASVSHGVLLFDSAWVPLPATARAPVSGQRRLLFAAGQYEVDLEISKVRRGRYDLLGQLLPSGNLPETAAVRLHRRSGPTVPIDARGFFAFEGISQGAADLTFRLGDRSIRLAQVPIG